MKYKFINDLKKSERRKVRLEIAKNLFYIYNSFNLLYLNNPYKDIYSNDKLEEKKEENTNKKEKDKKNL